MIDKPNFVLAIPEKHIDYFLEMLNFSLEYFTSNPEFTEDLYAWVFEVQNRRNNQTAVDAMVEEKPTADLPESWRG